MAEPWTADEHPLDVREILRTLDAHGVRHVLVGGRLDVLLVIDGPGGYASFARRGVRSRVSGARVLVISLEDLVESKETAGRPKDLAALGELRRLLAEQRRAR